MNILHLEASSGWGGQEMRILKEAEGMRDRGHTVIFGVMRGGGLVTRARSSQFRVYEVEFKKIYWIFSLFFLIWVILRHKIDLINTHSSLDGWLGGIAARICFRKVVRTRHLSTPIKKGFNSFFLYGNLADFVVTTCASVAPVIAEQSGKSIAKVRSIPTGVDPSRIVADPKESAAFREKIGVGSSDFLVGTVCFMRSWKGIDVFLQAASLLRDVPHIRFVVIGGGHAETYHRKAKELNLDGIVYFSGHLDSPFAAIGALDCFALLSTANEGVSQAILQAAYLRKPLIATQTGGLKEVCVDQETGFSVPVFDPEAVAQAVLALKENEPLRRKLGENGHLLVLRSFTWKQTLDQMEEVFLSTSSTKLS